jgi:multidrug efflux pump subunit AcrA (membrane-fusion protein)
MINNLEHTWVIGDFYQSDLALLATAAPATVRIPGGEHLSGRVDHVYPTLDRQRRTVPVRIEFANPDLRLRPGMYVDVSVRANLGRRVVVPRDAVVRTGRRDLVFVALSGGRFAPRPVQLGPPVDGGYVVDGGLDPGERIVTHATFLIDSESSLEAAIADMDGSAGGHNH